MKKTIISTLIFTLYCFINTLQAHAKDIENVLALTWHASFCELPYNSQKTDCVDASANDISSEQFSLHGLWPDDLDDEAIYPCYCNEGKAKSCSQKGGKREKVYVNKALWQRLQIAMPATKDGLHHYQWNKHGSCYEEFLSTKDQGADQDEYFLESLNLLDQVNESDLRDLFYTHKGKRLGYKQILKAAVQSFGKGADQRIFIKCDQYNGQNYITEIRLNLAEEISANSDIAELIHKAPELSKLQKRKSCTSGYVM